MFFLVAIVLLLTLPDPWNLVGFAVALAAASGEVLFWHRKVRGRQAAVGADTLIGAEGKALSACRPDGQVQLDGEIWEARCAAGVDAGAPVRVIGREGLTLLVEPAR